ncbi:hypothetical protein GGQ97_001446 [Sphingomonas kaistensis]|uniref:Uncharacterized protein n=1 Tax=Sphingomonas kaistensis TaxID=298708 RepID=A0A7X5Y5M9_9SPHN|nr:hypothetical protein [Sphingomonas kaistensis]NJC05653.1 hypothetical protein [Sphingomonas kaistensis]
MKGSRIIGALAGAGFCVAVIGAVEKLGHFALGAPATPFDATAAMHAVVLAAWVLGVGVGGFIGTGISKWAGTAWIVAALVVAGVIANAMSFPHPAWLVAAGILLPLVIAWMIARGHAARPSRPELP